MVTVSPTHGVVEGPPRSFISAGAVETSEDEVFGERERFGNIRDAIFPGQSGEGFGTFAIRSLKSRLRNKRLLAIAEPKLIHDGRRQRGDDRRGKTIGRRLMTPPYPSGQGAICVSDRSHSRVPVKNTLLFALKL